ncbi:MFS transporter, partial [Pseudomonas sp. K5]|uniref:MFS transporter n=1 Tax=Pseudomonas sp. K5 TaxID=1156313 RepID=UPI001D01908F
HQLLSVVTDAVIAYLAAQRAAGAQVLQVFDTWGGVLSPSMYREFSLRYLTRIARELERGDGDQRTPLILFGKGTGLHLAALADTGADALGVDWTLDLADAVARTGGRVALQGNLDPATLYGNPDAIERAAGATPRCPGADTPRPPGPLGCALEPPLPQLVAARVLQGVGGAMLLPVGRLAVMRSVSREQFLRAMSFIAIPALVGPLIGPTLGGWLVEVASWHWVFLINLPIGVIGYVAALKIMPDHYA